MFTCFSPMFTCNAGSLIRPLDPNNPEEKDIHYPIVWLVKQRMEVGKKLRGASPITKRHAMKGAFRG